MTHRPLQNPVPDDGPVVSLQQRFADRLAQAPGEAPAARVRKKKERTGEEPVALPGVAMPQPLHAQDLAGALRRDAASSAEVNDRGPARFIEPGLANPTLQPAQETPMPPAGEGADARLPEAHALQDRREPVAPAQVTTDGGAEHVVEERLSRSAPAEAPAQVVFAPPMRGDATPQAAPTARPAASQVPTRFPAPAPVAATAPSEAKASSVTVAFQSWGPGHEVRADWLPGGGVLVPGSERVGMALAAAASQPGAASIEGDGWRVEQTDADPERRERQRHDADQDA